MARIVPALQQLISSGDVRTSEDLAKVDRRAEIEWRIRVSDAATAKTFTYHTIRATVERMNRRAGAGLPMSALVPKTVTPTSTKTVEATPTKKAATKKSKKAKPTKKTSLKANELKTKLADAPTETAHVILLVDRSPSMLYPVTTANKDIPRNFFESERERLAADPSKKRHHLVDEQIAQILANLKQKSPHFLVSMFDFDDTVHCAFQARRADTAVPTKQPPSSSGTSIFLALADAVTRAYMIAQAMPVLVYLLTDGENYGPQVPDLGGRIKQLLGTGRATIAALGPKKALDFLRDLGVPSECIRDWEGDGTDLQVATKQAVSGVEKFSEAVKQGKTSLDSFFVDVVKAGFDAAACKKQLADVTSTLRVRKVNKFDDVETFVRDVLGETYSPGCGYYQIYKAETLKVGRKIILRPRGEDKFYTGPKVRELLGLPSDRDVKVEPKNLGEFLVYFQSASPNRKLTPDSDFLFDKSHVAGATAPTWTGGKAKAAK